MGCADGDQRAQASLVGHRSRVYTRVCWKGYSGPRLKTRYKFVEFRRHPSRDRAQTDDEKHALEEYRSLEKEREKGYTRLRIQIESGIPLGFSFFLSFPRFLFNLTILYVIRDNEREI